MVVPLLNVKGIVQFLVYVYAEFKHTESSCHTIWGCFLLGPLLASF